MSILRTGLKVATVFAAGVGLNVGVYILSDDLIDRIEEYRRLHDIGVASQEMIERYKRHYDEAMDNWMSCIEERKEDAQKLENRINYENELVSKVETLTKENEDLKKLLEEKPKSGKYKFDQPIMTLDELAEKVLRGNKGGDNDDNNS